MDRNNRATGLSSVIYGSVGVVFSLVVGFFGYALSGAGHGTDAFGKMVSSPEPFGFLIWPCVGCLLPWGRRWWVRGVVILLLLLNYCFVVSTIFFADDQYIDKTFQALPLVAFAIVACYVIIQLVIWTCLVRSLLATKQSRSVGNATTLGT